MTLQVKKKPLVMIGLSVEQVEQVFFKMLQVFEMYILPGKVSRNAQYIKTLKRKQQ